MRFAKKPKWVDDAEAQSLLREAEAALRQPAAKPKQ
jgi:hypothetical protein